ncbi:MAG: phosphatidylserine decarboxylase [Elusimicrobia bacterium]|nr:phosphatidylserine decarboxylase [Elusimicrobiota bacterium]MDD7502053.1 phosphatidylserine decarboxylase [Elusimicrobiota bacterium]MDY5729715.1 phosphatidylserine decarboxylase [Elusimicrobiaceae bacterium]
MLADIQRTFAKCFGWVGTVLPLGLKFFAIAVAAAAVFLFFDLRTLGVLCLLVACFCAFFFRDPKRNTVFADDEIACPADGTVLSIKTEEDPNSVVVRIFLSIFDVHVQRATVGGKTGDIFYHKGTFLFANNPEADKNERNLIQLFKDGDTSRFAHVEQITGAIARRIECWVKPQQEIKAGQHLGLVRFGSQVAVYLPKDKVRVLVKEGQKVQGAVTVLALWK